MIQFLGAKFVRYSLKGTVVDQPKLGINGCSNLHELDAQLCYLTRYSQVPKSWRNPKNLGISLGEGFCGSRGVVAFSLCLG